MAETRVEAKVALPVELPLTDGLIKEIQVLQNIEGLGGVGRIYRVGINAVLRI